jgi:hypothetical protein
MFYYIGPGVNVIKLFCPQFTNFNAKLAGLKEMSGKACRENP